MAIETYTVQLERVQAAIAAIEEGAQSYSIAGRSLTKADLGRLYDREKYLRVAAAREAATNPGIQIKYVVPQ